MNQKQFILSTCRTKHTIAGTNYIGRNPMYAKIVDPLTGLEKFEKVSKGVPFVRP